jgi:hypothetical protein
MRLRFGIKRFLSYLFLYFQKGRIHLLPTSTQTNKHQAQIVLFIKLGVQHLGRYSQNTHYMVGYKEYNRWEGHNPKLGVGMASFLGACLRHATRGVSRLLGRNALPVG